ncbi:MAG: N-succinylarginine dihydrolase [Sphingobium sp.]
MTVREVNFDGLIGPSHNYAGLSFGNIASARNADNASAPRAAALQGVAKMRRLIGLGLPQGLLLPHWRPATEWLRQLGFGGTDAQVLALAAKQDSALLRNAFSASAMWTANAATVSPAPDTGDGRCHLSVANLAAMPHRSIEHVETLVQLRLAFADAAHFVVHAALPACFGDEGAANIMRLAASHGDPGLTIFVYGEQRQGGFPARQSRVASEAVARRHGLDPDRTFFAQQSDEAIAAGAFHNDVVAVANETVLFAHEQAFADPQALRTFIDRLPGTMLIEVPASQVSLEDAISSYLFNSQLVTLPNGGMALVLPAECRETASVWSWLQEAVAGNGPIRRLELVEVRESMRNGGGPACLRLRVAVDDAAFAAIDPRFLVDDAVCDRLEAVIARHWPERIAPGDLGHPDLWQQCAVARAALLAELGFAADEV